MPIFSKFIKVKSSRYVSVSITTTIPYCKPLEVIISEIFFGNGRPTSCFFLAPSCTDNLKMSFPDYSSGWTKASVSETGISFKIRIDPLTSQHTGQIFFHLFYKAPDKTIRTIGFANLPVCMMNHKFGQRDQHYQIPFQQCEDVPEILVEENSTSKRPPKRQKIDSDEGITNNNSPTFYPIIDDFKQIDNIFGCYENDGEYETNLSHENSQILPKDEEKINNEASPSYLNFFRSNEIPTEQQRQTNFPDNLDIFPENFLEYF